MILIEALYIDLKDGSGIVWAEPYCIFPDISISEGMALMYILLFEK